MSMMRWQPFSELISLRQAMEKLFEDSLVTPSRILSTPGPGVTTLLICIRLPMIW